jgi:hypothetical protein
LRRLYAVRFPDSLVKIMFPIHTAGTASKAPVVMASSILPRSAVAAAGTMLTAAAAATRAATRAQLIVFASNWLGLGRCIVTLLVFGPALADDARCLQFIIVVL